MATLTRRTYSILDLAVGPGGRGMTWIPVADLLMGASLRLPLHVLHGVRPGPTLAVNAVIHGGEHFPLHVLWRALPGLDLQQLSGTLLVVPVANPIGFAANTRVVLEDDVDLGNVNRVFPGRRGRALFGSGDSDPSDRSLAERIASALTTTLLERADFALDLHCHQEGIGLVKCIQGRALTGRSAEWTPRMCKAWGFGLIHEYDFRDNTFSGQAEARGIPPCVAEIGTGASVSAHLERRLAQRCAEGLENLLRSLGMLPGDPPPTGRHLVFGHGPHVRPSAGGYLVSELDPTSLFEDDRYGVEVRTGQLLGRVFDPHRLTPIEDLLSPCDGVLYMARRSGPIEASGHAYAVADPRGGRWEEA